MNEKDPHQNTLSWNLKSLGIKRSFKSEVKKKLVASKNLGIRPAPDFSTTKLRKETMEQWMLTSYFQHRN